MLLLVGRTAHRVAAKGMTANTSRTWPDHASVSASAICACRGHAGRVGGRSEALRRVWQFLNTSFLCKSVSDYRFSSFSALSNCICFQVLRSWCFNKDLSCRLSECNSTTPAAGRPLISHSHTHSSSVPPPQHEGKIIRKY